MRISLFAFLPALLLCVGCSSQGRYTALYELSAAPVSKAAWGGMVGNYSGPVRSRVKTWMGTEGERIEEINVSIRGSAVHPLIFLRARTNYSTAWTGLGSRLDAYTNIPRMEYGAKKLIEASSHAPHSLVLEVPKNIYILRFNCPDTADVDELGIHGWRGSGRLQRVPEFPCSREAQLKADCD